MPRRSSFLEAKVMPGMVLSGSRMTLVSVMPNTIATISALTPGSSLLMPMEMTTATAHSSSPGRYG